MTELAVKIAQAVRILHGMDLLEVWGHVSGRKDDESFCILGHMHEKGRILSVTDPSDIVRTDFQGNTVEGLGRPPGEVYIHTEIYKRRAEVAAIVHHHGLACTTLSTLRQELLPLSIQATPFYQGTPIFDLPEQIDNPDVGKRLAETIGDKRAALIRGHGAVVTGSSVEEACVLSICMERAARVQLDASAIGKPEPIAAESLINGMTRGLSIKELVESWWHYGSSRFPL